jgi:phosphate transport system permease protein
MSPTAPIAVTPLPERGARRTIWSRLRGGDEIAYLITFLAAATVIVITALLVYELFENSAQSRHLFGWKFLTSQTWDPVVPNLGAAAFIYGTLVTSALALAIGIPLGVGAAIFLAELAPPAISSGLTFLIELLAAVPSVIFGLLGFLVLVPILQKMEPAIRAMFGWSPLFTGPFYGVSMLAAGVVLAIMIIPFIISISREVILAVPGDQREAALALGATRWETTWDVVVPGAKVGIFGSIFLALARSLGETMAVTMVIGNQAQIHASLFSPGYTIAAAIANEFAEASPGTVYISALFELALVLFGMTIVINAVARLLVLATGRKGQA